MIIGLTGTIASGKTTVAKMLVERGYEHFTYSDILRLEAMQRSIQPTRRNLQELGNQLKDESDNLGILSKMIVEAASGDDVVADGIRTPDEIDELRRYGKTLIIAVDADQRTRFERLRQRDRPGDPHEFKEFKRIDDHENMGKTPGQDIHACFKKADVVLGNDGSIVELKEKLGEALRSAGLRRGDARGRGQ